MEVVDVEPVRVAVVVDDVGVGRRVRGVGLAEFTVDNPVLQGWRVSVSYFGRLRNSCGAPDVDRVRSSSGASALAGRDHRTAAARSC